ncbi:hypothetical protein GMA11_00665 [Granulicatella sp. zg-ZJ]|uniref:hypothetical protein n=1 Tax=unclassified Granulicatella TaxID=2630493 RepID=UPI0013C112BE|nr:MULTISPECIES: hypothetical protein [unclassified Granulicatella]NEW61894.1 hypothetical protein [Granulicatella sp. zg-ZJ]NEW66968.1 hypothetical protein [Granulicatella sp. zg-84]QMI85193.1 hypothetical protein H1220_05545 [Carnobacteriaceae bacterium zg-84]
MIKKFYFFVCICLGLVIFQSCANKPVDQTVTLDTFSNGQFDSASKETFIRKIFFESNRMIVSIDFQKTENLDKMTKYLGSKYGLLFLGKEGAEIPDFYQKELTDKTFLKENVCIRGYEQGVPGYNSMYGKTYIVFYNPTIEVPNNTRTSWRVRMEWDRDKDKNKHKHYEPSEDIFLFTVDKDAGIKDDTGMTYRKVK